MKLINIHTHKKQDNNLSIINLFPEEHSFINERKNYSIGIHPWEVSKVDVDEQLKIVERYSFSKNIIAIGEIGLDKYHQNFYLQKEVFLKQIAIAQKSNKPIIIHCVKAFSDLLHILKSEIISVPIIIHRFSGNKTIADKLIDFGCYLSFGHELFNSKSKTQRVFKSINLKNIFFETDDANIKIEEVYKKASEIKLIKSEVLKQQISDNFQNVFKVKIY